MLFEEETYQHETSLFTDVIQAALFIQESVFLFKIANARLILTTVDLAIWWTNIPFLLVKSIFLSI